MSSPGEGNVSRTETPLPKDYDTSVSVMVTSDLLRSTLTEESRTWQGASKTCLLCGLRYFWRPSRCRDHLGLVGSSKQVQVWNPYPEHSDRSSEIVREVKERDARATEESRDVTKRYLESGTPGDPIMTEMFGSGGKKARVSNHGPFIIVRTREELDMQWSRPSVSTGLPMSFFENQEVLKDVLMTAECGQTYIRTKPGGVKEPTLSHRTYFTTKLIPKLDKLIDDKNMTRIHLGILLRL
jgi:hypothetical protein